MKNKIFKSILVSFLLILAGCGYTTRSMISDKYKTIYITPFVNKTDITSEAYTGSQYRLYRPHLESDITTFVVNKFLFDGNLKPVKIEDADMVLKGELVDFRRDALRYDNNDNVIEYRVSIVVNLSMFDKKENKLIWQERGFTGDTTYYPSGTTTSTSTSGTTTLSETSAVNSALADLARRVVERAVEQW